MLPGALAAACYRGAPVDRRSASALTIALALGWLAIGYLNVARGAAHAGAGYRFWAFQHHCYSDVIALHGDRYLGGGRPVPYVEDQVEYPVLLGAVLWLASFAPGGALGHFTATYALLAGCLALALAALFRTPGARPWWLGATPVLVYYAGLNWDLLPVALIALALLALDGDRPGAGGALAALGASAKLFPIALVPPAAAALWARGPRARVVRFAAALAAVIAVLNLPLALAAPDGWSWFFRYNAARGAENSIWDALHVQRGTLLDALSLAPVAISSALGALAAGRAAGGGAGSGRAVRLATALALVVWIATNKVWSPQYALYGFLAGALAAAPLSHFLVLSAVSAADFHLSFEVRARRWDPWFRDNLWHPANVVRTVLWIAFAAWIARELWREARAAGAGSGAGSTQPSGAVSSSGTR